MWSQYPAARVYNPHYSWRAGFLFSFPIKPPELYKSNIAEHEDPQQLPLPEVNRKPSRIGVEKV